jgi:hypothetical protein
MSSTPFRLAFAYSLIRFLSTSAARRGKRVVVLSSHDLTCHRRFNINIHLLGSSHAIVHAVGIFCVGISSRLSVVSRTSALIATPLYHVCFVSHDPERNIPNTLPLRSTTTPIIHDSIHSRTPHHIASAIRLQVSRPWNTGGYGCSAGVKEGGVGCLLTSGVACGMGVGLGGLRVVKVAARFFAVLFVCVAIVWNVIALSQIIRITRVHMHHHTTRILFLS